MVSGYIFLLSKEKRCYTTFCFDPLWVYVYLFFFRNEKWTHLLYISQIKLKLLSDYHLLWYKVVLQDWN